MNDKTNKIISTYIDSTDTDFALLLNGPWGCGKTYYIKNELYKIVNEKDKRLIYVSMNGVSNFESIKRKITLQLLYNGSKFKNVDFDLIDDVFEISGNIPEIGGVFTIVSELRKKFETKKTEAINLDKVFIVFDDLERISGDNNISVFLGLIYENYVKKGVKALIVSDESNITNKSYLLVKEKIIRRTVCYEPNFDEQIISLVKNKYNEYDVFLNDKIEVFISMINKVQIRNLRTICFIFDNYIDIIKAIKEKYRLDQYKFIFANIMILTTEFKNGNISIEDQYNKKGLDSISQFHFFWELDKKKDEEKTYSEKFYEKYIKQLGFNFIYINEIFTFILTGYINMDFLEKELDALFYNSNPKEEEVIKRIGSYREMEEKELYDAIQELVNYTKSGYYHLSKLPYIYSLLKYHEEQKYLTDWHYNVEQIIDEGFNNSIKNADNIPLLTDIEVYLYDDQQSKKPYYKTLVEKIKYESTKMKTRVKCEDITHIFELAISNNDDIWVYLEKYPHSEFFTDVVLTNNAKYFLTLNNAAIRYFESFLNEDILRISNAGVYGYSQKKPLEEIVDYLNENLEISGFDNMRKKRLLDLINKMRMAINHLEETKK